MTHSKKKPNENICKHYFFTFLKFREKTILDKYNEELDGIQKKSFKLGKQGEYDASDAKFIERLNQEHKDRAIKLDVLNELKFATDYFTPQEVVSFRRFCFFLLLLR